MLALPAVLTVYFAFNGGGFFPGAPAAAALVLAAVLVGRALVAREPVAGLGVPALVAVATLAGFAGWTLVSAEWSHAPGRAIVEYDRALMYLLAFTLIASLPRSARALRVILRATAAAMFAVCAAGLTTRILPHVWPIGPGLSNSRLSFPLTYWNALGLMAAIGAVLCFHLAADEREPGVSRVLGAAAAPVFGATLLLTFSRGGIAAAATGIVVYAALARPRGLLSAALTALPAAAVGFYAAYAADLLARNDPTTPAAVAQGRSVAVAVGVAMALTALLRGLLLRLDRRIVQLAVSRRAGLRRLSRIGVSTAVAVALLTALALGAPHAISRSYDRFVHGNKVDPGSLRTRLTDPGNDGRLYFWRTSVKGFDQQRLHGTGAGTYAVRWAQLRPRALDAQDGHSLYVEAAGELGIVGLLLIAGFVLTILATLARRIARPQRAAAGAVFAVFLIWALHAGIDWDWEMPAVTLPVLALAAFGTARPRRPPPRVRRLQRGRTPAAVAVLVLAVTPYTVLSSQARIEQASAAFRAGDCRTAIHQSLAATDVLSVRAEPFELLALCDGRAGQTRLAEAAAQAAIARDPGYWRYRYDEALVRAAAGTDPRPAARLALALNPHDPVARWLARAVRGDSPPKWRGAARAAPLFTP